MPPRALFSFPSSISLPKYARTVGRGVRLQIRPRPRNIQDSRHILTWLRKYGHIVLYQNMRYDPLIQSENIILALYREKAEAEKLIAASPVQLQIGTDGVKELSQHHLQQDQQEQEQDEGDEAAASLKNLGDVFDIWIEPSETNFHARQLRQPYSGPYTYNHNSAMVEDLRRRVPIPALADLRFDQGSVPLRQRRNDAAEGEKQHRWNRSQSLWKLWKEKQEQ